MNRDCMLKRLRGCYVTVPTQFQDTSLELDRAAIRRHVEFLLAGGIREGTGLLLAGGAAGDFSTMTLAEQFQVAETIVKAADGKIPVTIGRVWVSRRR